MAAVPSLDTHLWADVLPLGVSLAVAEVGMGAHQSYPTTARGPAAVAWGNTGFPVTTAELRRLQAPSVSKHPVHTPHLQISHLARYKDSLGTEALGTHY